ATSGTAVTLTAAAAGCPQPQYEFWVLPAGSQVWQLARPYSTSPTYTWATTGKPAGTYSFSIWTRDSSRSGTAADALGAWDAYTPAQYSLTSQPCRAVTPSAAPASTAIQGTTVTVTGSATGCSGPLYEFWVLAPGSSTWRLAQPYSTSPTF